LPQLHSDMVKARGNDRHLAVCTKFIAQHRAVTRPSSRKLRPCKCGVSGTGFNLPGSFSEKAHEFAELYLRQRDGGKLTSTGRRSSGSPSRGFNIRYFVFRIPTPGAPTEHSNYSAHCRIPSPGSLKSVHSPALTNRSVRRSPVSPETPSARSPPFWRNRSKT